MEAAKQVLRQRMKTVLKNMPPSLITAKSQRLREQLLTSLEYRTARRLGIYLNLPQEPNTLEIIRDALATGRKVFVPQLLPQELRRVNNLQGNGSGMCMRHLHNLEQIDLWPLNKWNIREPPPPSRWNQIVDQAAEEGGLDLLIVPGISFTRSGHRLGRGGGYYDRYLSWFRKQSRSPNFQFPVLIALAFDEQIVDELPVEPHDIEVNRVIFA